MSNRKKTAVAAAAVLLIAAGAWALGLFGERIDPEVAAIERDRQRVFSSDATDAERRAFRQRVEGLSESQRRQLFERGRPDMQRHMAERMREVFSLPPDELKREIAERADAILEARSNPDRGPGRGAGRPPGPPGGGSEAQRDARRKQRLDHVDPATRAQFSEFRRMVNTELESRGADPLSGRDMRRLMGPPPG